MASGVDSDDRDLYEAQLSLSRIQEGLVASEEAIRMMSQTADKLIRASQQLREKLQHATEHVNAELRQRRRERANVIHIGRAKKVRIS